MIKVFTEAGKGIGFGHLTRCSALVEQLELQGEEVELIVYLNEFEMDFSKFTQLDWLSQAPEKLLEGTAIAVFDSYLVTEDWLEKASALHCKLIHIDDYNRIKYPVELIINPNVFAEDLDYSNQHAKWVGGSEYVIIRAPFRDDKSTVQKIYRPQLLITMGGSDYRQLLPKLAKWALNLELFNVRMVAPDGLRDVGEKVKVLPLLNAEEMAREMKQADVVISACGQTLHELASLRKPTIGICLDIDQVPNHKFYNSNGFIRRNLWWNQADLKEGIEEELKRLSSHRERKNAIDRLKEFNPNGVNNVAKAILDYKI